MCSRTDPLPKKLDVGGFKLKNQLSSKYKQTGVIAPTDRIAIVKDKEPNILQDAHWGLIPAYSTEFKANWKFATFNAKKENLFELTTWKKLIGHKHCVVVTGGFYEWQYEIPEKKKGPHIFSIKSALEPLTIMAGLYEEWENKATGEVLTSCTMITNPANELMADIHNTKARMPAFLDLNNYKLWNDQEISITDRMNLLNPVGNDFLKAVEVNKNFDQDKPEQPELTLF